ncbi:Epsin-2 [Durusdinium trenchii]|uniref:Epsin-2 n=1 Tax=Durusdinium trenchii TaxID=1381693 RepID=A0ABP0K7N7_9DINO
MSFGPQMSAGAARSVEVPDVPRKFKQGTWFPETCQQEIGWIQGNCGKLAHRSEPAGSKPTRLGVGWLMKDGHGGPINKLAAARANDADLAVGILALPCEDLQPFWSPFCDLIVKALQVDPECPKTRKSKELHQLEMLQLCRLAAFSCHGLHENCGTVGLLQKALILLLREDGNVREELGVPHKPKIWSHLAWHKPSHGEYGKRRRLLLEGNVGWRSRKLTRAGENQMRYKPLSNSDVAKFADAYSKACRFCRQPCLIVRFRARRLTGMGCEPLREVSWRALALIGLNNSPISTCQQDLLHVAGM